MSKRHQVGVRAYQDFADVSRLGKAVVEFRVDMVKQRNCNRDGAGLDGN